MANKIDEWRARIAAREADPKIAEWRMRQKVRLEEANRNLNEQWIRTDGSGEVLENNNLDTAEVSICFRNVKQCLLACIEEADYVFGCVAWLTDLDVLDALAQKRGVSIVVQKEDFLRPDILCGLCGDPRCPFPNPGSRQRARCGESRNRFAGQSSWRKTLSDAYKKLRGLNRCDFGRGSLIRTLSTGQLYSDDQIEAVRCLGVPNRGPSSPRMHHKFAVFAKRFFGPSAPEPLPFEGPLLVQEKGLFAGSDGWRDHFHWSDEDGSEEWIAAAVWTGSFNWTKGATNSFENAVLLKKPEIADAYYKEFQQMLALSEPLDWNSEYVEPEWRIGT